MLSGKNYNQIFEENYSKLNPAQKEAVDTIDGPVMVVAGPGTGKTQTIALRIANILKETQLNPQNILCLTFTDSAVNTMRTRLLNIIGTAAYGVKIMTFHSFCNEIIISYPEKFSEFGSNISPLNDVERLKIFNSLLEQLPYNSSLRPFGNSDTYLFEIPKIISGYKKDNVSIETIEDEIKLNEEFFIKTSSLFQEFHALHYTKLNETVFTQLVNNIQNLGFTDFSFVHYIIKLREDYTDEKFTRLRNEIFSEFSNGFSVEITKKQKELVEIFKKYQVTLKDLGKYDYDDMIVAVVNKLKVDKELLALLQEKYQYILVDEYQDTNNSQNEVLRLLGSFWSDPNIFTVGDDDQSIFRFQGASIENMLFFYNTYLSKIKIISLTENYRSQQLILDSARAVISNNGMQVHEKIRGLSKDLIAYHKEYPQKKIKVTEYKEPVSESFDVADKIKNLLDSGVKGNQIAIIYRDHSDSTYIKEALRSKQINYRLEKGENALDNFEIKKFITFLKYLIEPQDDKSLFKILNYDYWDFNKLDLLKIFEYFAQERLTNYFQLIQNKDLLIKIGVSNPDKFVELSNKITNWRSDIYNFDATVFFNRVIRESGFMQYILTREDYTILMSKLSRVYSELKNIIEDKLDYTLVDFIKDLDVYNKYKLELIDKLTGVDDQNAVRLMTAHGAKGAEYEYVFIVRCQSRKWGDNPGKNKIKLPYGLLKNQFVSEEDDEERRLFYVAMTRAKLELSISYTRFSLKQTSQQPSRFIKEIPENFIEFNSFVSNLETETKNQIEIIEHTENYNYSNEAKAILNNLISGFKLNVSQVISYRKCPRCFYFNSILKVPRLKNKSASFGSVVHEVLHNYSELKKSGKIQSEDEFISTFIYGLKKERLSEEDFLDALQKGEHILRDYYKNRVTSIPATSVSEANFKNLNVQVAGIPISGKIDRIDFLDPNQLELQVIDYKTGNPDNTADKLSVNNMGDYLMQLYFYKLLIENSTAYKGKVLRGSIEFIEPSKKSGSYILKDFDLNSEGTNRVVEIIKEVYSKILKLDFSEYNKDTYNRCENEEYHYINWLF